VSESIVSAIEAVGDQIAAQAGQHFGANLAAAEALVAFNGDYLVSLAYAALFFPALVISDGVPMARFATSDREQPLDCIHVDLLHHTAAVGRSPEVYAALGQALAAAWTYALQRQGLAGRFAFNSSRGFDVVYEP
jgi:hypothetical protein